jgi:hypothetical protein
MILDIYISIGIIVFLSCYFQLRNFNKIFYVKSWYNKYIKIIRKKPSIIDFRFKEDYDLFQRLNVLLLFDFIWILGLLFTKYMIISSIFLLVMIVINFLMKKLDYNQVSKILMLIMFLSKFVLVGYIIVNKFLL